MAAVPTFSSNRFTYNAATKTFAAEISDLNLADTFCIAKSGDPSFSIISAKTGNAVDFTFSSIERDADRDIMCWHFRQLNNTIPGEVCNINVTIFND